MKWCLAAVLCLVWATTALAAGKDYMLTANKGETLVGATQPEGVAVKPLSQTTPLAPTKEGEDASQVEIFVTDWCPYCLKAMEFLKNRGVGYKEYNVQRDPAAARRLLKYSQRGGVPFALICGQEIMGFTPEGYDRALAACKKAAP